MFPLRLQHKAGHVAKQAGCLRYVPQASCLPFMFFQELEPALQIFFQALENTTGAGSACFQTLETRPITDNE